MPTVFRLLALLTLLVAVPAYADLTALENADVKRLVESSSTLRTGERYLVESLTCCSTPEARPTLANALEAFRKAQIEHWRALAFLLHTGLENPTPQPAFTDEQWRTQAWFHLDRYRTSLDAISATLTSAQAHHVSNAAYQDNLRRASLWLGYAKTHASAMNRDLLYLTPWPALRDGKTIATVVAVHGNYRMMQWYVNRAKNYELDAHDWLLMVYRSGAPGAVIRDAWVSSSNLLDGLDHATALLANVTSTPTEAGEDRFCRALRVGKLLTVDVPQRYQQHLDVVAGLIQPPALRDAVRKIADSWKHVDRATWEALVFPESERCPKDLRD